jgi:hypothetical protein
MNFQLCKSDEDNKCYNVGKGCKMLKYYVVNILLKHQLQNENPIQEGQIQIKFGSSWQEINCFTNNLTLKYIYKYKKGNVLTQMSPHAN